MNSKFFSYPSKSISATQGKKNTAFYTFLIINIFNNSRISMCLECWTGIWKMSAYAGERAVKA